LLPINHTEGRTFGLLAAKDIVLVCRLSCTRFSFSVQEIGVEELFGGNSWLITLFIIFALQHAMQSRIMRLAMSAERTIGM
jgi:hypothetical protein